MPAVGGDGGRVVSPIPELLFVYGTLQQHGGAHHLLAGQVSLLGPARLQGRLYALNGYPGAVLSDRPGEQVQGELYRMHRPRELLARLDIYEEAGPRFPEPREYRRAQVRVIDAAQVRHAAWTYLYARDVSSLVPLPDGCWQPEARCF